MYLVTFHQWYHVEKAAGELQPNYTEFTNNRSISPFTDLILKFIKVLNCDLPFISLSHRGTQLANLPLISDFVCFLGFS